MFGLRCALSSVWPLLALLAAAGCGRAGGATDPKAEFAGHVEESLAAESELNPPEPAAGDLIGRLEALRARGGFEEYVDAALNAAAERPDDPAIRLHEVEALLATGRASESERAALRSAALAADRLLPEVAIHALKLWVIARLRQSKPLDDREFAVLLEQLPPRDQTVRLLAFWRDTLGERAPYRISQPGTTPVDVPMSDAAAGSLPFELAAVEARANGVSMPRVFIDTGAQHTVMTVAAARSAGVEMGFAGTPLIGFKGLLAGPAVIETLALGGLILHDVPVLVGDSAPLVSARGQISLGTELMHHVRFTIDYPARRVTAVSADSRSATSASPAIFEIPLWTFSQICLAQGQLPSGAPVRVLVDTGDRPGTFVSYRWARRHVPQLRGSGAPLLIHLKKRNMELDALEIGSLALSGWPVHDTIPNELDHLHLVDVILGHDLLWPYRLSIDLPARMLRLHGGTSPQPHGPAGGSTR